MYFIACILLAVSVNANSNSKYCSNLPNGLGRLRNGVDVTTLDLLPLDFTGDSGFRMPIIDFTCDLGKTIKINGKEYDVPDQVISIDQLPSGWLNADVNIYKSSSDITNSMSANADVSVIGGLFSAGGSYKKMQRTISNSSKYIEDVKAYVSASKINVYPFWGLIVSNAAQMYMDKFLPKRIEGNVTAYKNFINYFGTHFLEYGKYGGLIRLMVETDKSYYQSRSTKDVEVQAKGSFFNLIKAGGGGGSSTIKIDTKFTQASSTTVRYYGGDTNLLGKDNGIPTWQPTVADNPWLFSCKLVPIYNLITDTNKKTAMKRAVEIHTDKAYLQALERLLYSFKAGKAVRAKIDNLTKQVEVLLKQDMPSHNSVQSLGTTIKTNLSPPSWYVEKTKLCYRWYPDGDGGQCGGGASRLLCTNPGRMTSYYRDDTDKRGGGCQMSWGIMPDNPVPSWFNQVQICYKWWPDGDGGQCGGGAKRLLCANVGKYTGYYRDDTDSRGGGCQMQWKLSVPSSAPLWMLNSKLCFEWYPDGDGGQCGGGAARSLCASVNEFTPAYRDDTDRRGGGCQMRWGIKI